jgi:hypothetical protein
MKFSKEDVLDALGIELKSSTDWLLPAIIGCGVGAFVGATVAMLIAPKTGAELREDLLAKGKDLVNRGREQMSNFAGRNETAAGTPASPSKY